MAKRDQFQATQDIQPQRQADFFINVTSDAGGKDERVGVFACYTHDKDGKENALEMSILNFLLEGGDPVDVLETLQFNSIELNKQHKGEAAPKVYTFGAKKD